jgi:hypothetical protein
VAHCANRTPVGRHPRARNRRARSCVTRRDDIGLEVPFIAGLEVGAGVYSTGNGESGFFIFFQADAPGQYASLGFGFGW